MNAHSVLLCSASHSFLEFYSVSVGSLFKLQCSIWFCVCIERETLCALFADTYNFSSSNTVLICLMLTFIRSHTRMAKGIFLLHENRMESGCFLLLLHFSVPSLSQSVGDVVCESFAVQPKNRIQSRCFGIVERTTMRTSTRSETSKWR